MTRLSDLPEDEQERLKELDQKLYDLFEEYGVEIGGCGCCGSPWLDAVGDNWSVRFAFDGYAPGRFTVHRAELEEYRKNLEDRGVGL